MSDVGMENADHHAEHLRLMVMAETAMQRTGLSVLLAPMSPTQPVLLRNFDVLREIGDATGDAQRETVAALAAGVDAIVVVLDDAAIAIAEDAVREGIAAVAETGVPVLLLAGDTDHEAAHVATWMARSVRGVLPLDAPVHELIAGIRASIAGLTVLEPRIASALAESAARMPGAGRRAALAGRSAAVLTNREREVLGLLAVGHATKTIARDLGISAHTVKAHVESIFAKLGATTRAEAVAIGVRRGAVML